LIQVVLLSCFNDKFEQFSPPEIIRRPVDDLLLQKMEKMMNSKEFLFYNQSTIIKHKSGCKMLKNGRRKKFKVLWKAEEDARYLSGYLFKYKLE